ncbi:MAG: HAMP domain-containing protein [Neisseriaceae bacterium]|nr:HAMP domain-containing protein [Neisseriaceae bacterium]
MGRFLIIGTVLTIIILYLLSISTYAETLSAQFKTVSAVSSVIALSLLFSLVRQIWRLKKDAKAQVLGAKLTQRLVRMFVGVVLLPSLALLFVSSFFIKTSIDSWFSDEITQSLNRSVDLSKRLLDDLQQKALSDAQGVMHELQTATEQGESVSQFVSRYNNPAFFQVIAFRYTDHFPLAYGGSSNEFVNLPDASEFPPNDEPLSNTINIGNTMFVQVWLLNKTENERQWLLFRQPVNAEIAQNIVYIENARASYAASTYRKNGLQTFFIITLVMATLLAMVLALLAAVYFARKFIAPLASLAQATNAVAQGDFTRRAAVYREDELGILSARFNRMVTQLQNAQLATEQMHIQQENARRHLELVLSTLSSDVMTLDEAGSLKTFNDGARRILDYPLNNLVGTPSSAWQRKGQEKEIADFIHQLLPSIRDEHAHEIEYKTSTSPRILMGRAVQLPNRADILVVFDDVTDLTSAQKEAAWGEVARRLAHEIKNPLTPIRLSAERLAMKLTDKLDENDANMLIRSTNTIINQVDALQELVEGFRNYARSGSLKLEKLDFTQIVDEILVLYEHASEYHLNIKRYPEPLFIRADNTAMRQVLHNLFKNAAEAAVACDNPQIWVTTQKDDDSVVLLVRNNGKIFPANMLHQIFEPYITDKPTGTGLGLAVVKKIIDEHQGTVWAGNDDNTALVKVTLPLVMEKPDEK